MEKLYEIAHPLGRILIGALFLSAGLGKIMGGAAIGGYIESKLPGFGMMAWPVSLFEVIAGFFMVIGYHIRATGIVLVAFCLVTGLIFHGFADQTGMMKNIAIAGGLLVLISKGSGGMSFDKS